MAPRETVGFDLLFFQLLLFSINFGLAFERIRRLHRRLQRLGTLVQVFGQVVAILDFFDRACIALRGQIGVLLSTRLDTRQLASQVGKRLRVPVTCEKTCPC
jgi:hypothetical protein